MSSSLRIKRADLDRYRRVAKLEKDSALAKAMGFDQGGLSRVLRGLQEPGGRFISGLVMAFGGALTLDDLFEVVETESDTDTEVKDESREPAVA